MTGDPPGAPGEPGLSVAGARALLGRAGVRTKDVRVSLVHRHNHVWRIGTADGAYFVKAWTKDWYDWADALTTGALNADHEAAAYELLLLGALVLLPLPVRRWKSPASTRRRSFRTGSGIGRTGGAACQSRARRRTSGRVGPGKPVGGAGRRGGYLPGDR